jgi:hypothetical protein
MAAAVAFEGKVLLVGQKTLSEGQYAQDCEKDGRQAMTKAPDRTSSVTMTLEVSCSSSVMKIPTSRGDRVLKPLGSTTCC